MSESHNLPCPNCEAIGVIDGCDGFFYCCQCGSKTHDIILTGVAEEDMMVRGAGDAGVAIYSHINTRQVSRAVKVERESQSQSHHFSTSQSQFWENLDLEEDSYEKEVKMDDETIPFNDGVGPIVPEDFGSTGILFEARRFEEYAEEVRMRYVVGLQLMIELQCEVLVKEFKVSPIICGIAATTWLRFVTTTRVFDDAWGMETIQDSENQHQGPENIKPISSRHRAEPHNLYGQRAVVILSRSLRKKIPLSCSLAISFLACHVAREAVLPIDIMKWSLEGKLPYFAAFIDIEKRIGQTSKTCPLSSKIMFRPSRITPLQKLESLAASIAHIIGLNLPPVNFHAIAGRFLDKLSLPTERIFPHACRIYEWSMPPDLWLSTNELRLPSRVCVMSILIISIRILYNLHGFGEWEKSLSVDWSASSSPSLKKHSSHLNSSNLHNLELTAAELLHKIEARYHEIGESHEYSKDLSNYLQHCKDVVFVGLESLLEDHPEERMIEEFWNYYQNEKNSEQGDVDQKVTSNEKRLREASDDRLSNEGKRFKDEDETHFEQNRCRQSQSSETLQSKEEPSIEDEVSTQSLKDEAIRQMKLDMEEKRFYYIPPRVNPKRFDYLHYGRKIDEGALTYAAHADYYILLRACARVAQVDVRIMHIAVLNLEKRLGWFEDRIQRTVTSKFSTDLVLEHHLATPLNLNI